MSATLATEDVLIIETPERVPLHFALASIGNRFIACAIDHAIQAITVILMLLAFITLANYSSLGDRAQQRAEVGLRSPNRDPVLIVSGYFAFFEWVWSGQIPESAGSSCA